MCGKSNAKLRALCLVKCDVMKPLKFENPKVDGYRDLIVGAKSIASPKLVYAFAKMFPADNKFGLISQMRRAAVSISSNIVKGQARHPTGEFIQFISHARGSVSEFDTQLHLAAELGFATDQHATACFELRDKLRRMLNAVHRKLKPTSKIPTRHKSPVPCHY